MKLREWSHHLFVDQVAFYYMNKHTMAQQKEQS